MATGAATRHDTFCNATSDAVVSIGGVSGDMSTILKVHGITTITTLADSLGCTDETKLSTLLSVHLDHPALVNCSTTSYPDLHVERPQHPLNLPFCKITISARGMENTPERRPDLPTKLQYNWLAVFSIPDLPTELPYSLLTVFRGYRAGKLHYYDDDLECYLDPPTKLRYSWLTTFQVSKAGLLQSLLNTTQNYDYLYMQRSTLGLRIPCD